MEKQPQKKTNDHLANERTFLAWIRTSIGIMGLGFVVVKFSMFIKQLTLMLGGTPHSAQHGFSSLIGIILVALGSLTALTAFLNYKKIQKQIEHEQFFSNNPLITVITCGLILISALLIWYLIEST
ncbi:protein of unknown function DUF202 [Pseudopedobacter saltans DSM 12145]|uniref:DUF202 domain-containing protein n=1 Tax=Pseudopedobacter saltans (strain ATCC 51119 / DSM 12145 / JCM 21818 / CCUG 39354 / LMG 10337 / NBRC 100064 / NCIMB 13643) TaxID=762903 RepID=F0SCG3_PSESL|nr:DUF202 domain-containing protein [Pseudopedobacter saltans]ADY52797.1 protein of unknown function DUF202 [Pseudopedobacter saltans DSM 12145]